MQAGKQANMWGGDQAASSQGKSLLGYSQATLKPEDRLRLFRSQAASKPEAGLAQTSSFSMSCHTPRGTLASAAHSGPRALHGLDERGGGRA